MHPYIIFYSLSAKQMARKLWSSLRIITSKQNTVFEEEMTRQEKIKVDIPLLLGLEEFPLFLLRAERPWVALKKGTECT